MSGNLLYINLEQTSKSIFKVSIKAQKQRVLMRRSGQFSKLPPLRVLKRQMFDQHYQGKLERSLARILS